MANSVIFTRKGIQNFVMGIMPGKNEDELNRLSGGGGFHFRYVTDSGMTDPMCAYVATDQKVISYLRHCSKKFPELNIKQDLSLMSVGCPYCSYSTEGNTAKDQEALNNHIADEHDDFEEGRGDTERVEREVNPDIPDIEKPLSPPATMREAAVVDGETDEEQEQAPVRNEPNKKPNQPANKPEAKGKA